MLKNAKMSLPKKVETVSTLNTVTATTFAVRTRAYLGQPLVALIKTGTLPIGLTIANSAMPVLNK